MPKPIKMGSLSRWSQSEILAAVEYAKAKRNAGSPSPVKEG
ncbi:conserved hypothetical protein [Brucella abortus bv. 9 str. C68]|nr:conserved hypothetical protein [Brucella abortus bv. 9 str. C68]